MSRFILLGIVGLLAVACTGTPQVTAPTPVPTTSAAPIPPAPASLPSDSWNVTIQTLSDSGPSFCIYQPSVGSTFHGNYQLVWNGDTVMFVPPDPFDWDWFTAKVSGLNFAASTGPYGSGSGMCAHYIQASTLSGSFSPDYSSFTATVRWSFTLDSGQIETITFSWVGTRHA
jgi:hypothetical protein